MSLTNYLISTIDSYIETIVLYTAHGNRLSSSATVLLPWGLFINGIRRIPVSLNDKFIIYNRTYNNHNEKCICCYLSKGILTDYNFCMATTIHNAMFCTQCSDRKHFFSSYNPCCQS